MKACVVFCTIRATESFKAYAANFRKFGADPDILVVDETGETRKLIHSQLEGFNIEFYGQKERQDWFKNNQVDPRTVPSKTTDVIGFGLLVAHPREYDIVVFVDDDTYPLQTHDFLGQHYESLTNRVMKVQYSENNWVNPHPRMFPRGYPYVLRKSCLLEVCEREGKTGSVLNMGLWRNVPDLNAIDYLYHGSLAGQYHDKELLASESYVLGSNYMPLSRMNIAFKPKIIPAFYQFTGEEYGMGRYGDVFSGLFLMKITKHLGDNVSFGKPVCVHNKEPRDVFRDIRSECEAVKLNEKMWQVLDKFEVHGSSYAECYLSLADGLQKHRDEFHVPDFIDYLVERMNGWVEAVEA